MKRSAVFYSVSVLMAMLISVAVPVDAADKPNIVLSWATTSAGSTSAPTTGA